ncbi:MAG TPA: hypothetical protein VKA31_00350 [Mariprofundaceae bacterium]|nr:hypothetical protein [Mariprofundaceae bacterium]
MTDQCYRISTIAGKFDHVIGEDAALTKARELAGAPEDTTLDELRREWGVTVAEVSEEDQKAVGL